MSEKTAQAEQLPVAEPAEQLDEVIEVTTTPVTEAADVITPAKTVEPETAGHGYAASAALFVGSVALAGGSAITGKIGDSFFLAHSLKTARIFVETSFGFLGGSAALAMGGLYGWYRVHRASQKAQ
jgi:hypothetical protein